MRRSMVCACGAVWACLVGWPVQGASAQGWMPPPPEKRCPSVWGADDERGAGNLQTPETVLRASKVIREGKMYELGKVLDRTIPMSPGRTFSLNVQRTSGPNGRNQQGGNEETVFTELGQMGTQFDGLAHQQLGPYLYNCVETEKVVRRGGFTKLGVEKAGSFFTRGVLLDIAALKGVDMLPDDYMITVADIEAALKQQNVDVGKGDAVLIRTGWGRLWGRENDRFIKGEPGIGLEAADFLVQAQRHDGRVRQLGGRGATLSGQGPIPAGARLPAQRERHLPDREPRPRGAGARQDLRVRLHRRAAQAARRHWIERGADSGAVT